MDRRLPSLMVNLKPHHTALKERKDKETNELLPLHDEAHNGEVNVLMFYFHFSILAVPQYLSIFQLQISYKIEWEKNYIN